MITMERSVVTLLCLVTVVLFSGCASICETNPLSKTVNGTEVYLPPSQIPCNKTTDYDLAASLAVDVIFSEELIEQLDQFMASNLNEGLHIDAWEGHTAKSIVESLRSTIGGTYAETYGGISGLFLFLVYGNIAYDGTLDGPIRLNRWPLKNRTVAQIANTIAHEVAHRAGYTHPNSSSSLEVANFEPPYVIGNIVEKLVAEKVE